MRSVLLRLDSASNAHLPGVGVPIPPAMPTGDQARNAAAGDWRPPATAQRQRHDRRASPV